MRQEPVLRARRRRWTGIALVLAVCLAGLGATAGAALAVEQVQQRHAGQLMDQYADDVARAVANETARYSDALLDLAAAVGAQSDLTAVDFNEVTSRLSRLRLPGATGVSFGISATDAQVSDVQSVWRGKGSTGLTLAPVGTGLEHMFSVLSRPLDGIVVKRGRDLSQVAEPAEALRMSRDTGEVAASRTYVLLKDRTLPAGQQQMSFLLAMAVHGGAGTPDAGRFRGWVTMSMRSEDFINETLRFQSRGAVSVTLIDLSGGASRTVASFGTRAASNSDALDRSRTVTVGQRTWQLRVFPTATLQTVADRRRAPAALAIGVLLTLMLTALVGILAGARNRALAKVDKATGALRDDIENRKATEIRLREREAELRHLAFHDPLTGLANRVLFHERVEHGLATHSRSVHTLAVLFIDLDGFKQINDHLGHSVGDAVLREVAARLLHCVRASDTVARFGGDEFAILAEQIVEPGDAEIVADRVVRALQQPFEVEGQTCQLTASVGVALRQPDDHTPDGILQSADVAMYEAKTLGKGRYVVAGEDRDLVVPASFTL